MYLWLRLLFAVHQHNVPYQLQNYNLFIYYINVNLEFAKFVPKTWQISTLNDFICFRFWEKLAIFVT